MKLPNFIIIGAPKAGTTSLFNYLRQHPQIYMSSYKEPAYYAPEVYQRRKKEYQGRSKFRFGAKKPLYGESETTPLSLEEYCTLFQSVENETAIGEASTCYLSELNTPKRIKQFLPNVKLITILRNPVERAYSDYCYDYRDDIEERSFDKILQEDPEHYYFTRGFYYLYLKRYFDVFEPSQIKICFQEDLNTSPLSVIQDIFRFLSVDYTYEPQDLHRSNVSGIPKSRLIHNFVFGINPFKSTLKHFFSEKLRQNLYLTISKYNLSPKPSLSLELRQRLIDIYREDILKLQKLINKDLSHWLDAN